MKHSISQSRKEEERMPIKKTLLTLCGWLCFGIVVAASPVGAVDGYPEGYTPSKPEETGATNILARFGALSTYVNDSLEAAGGANAPECFRNCLTVQINSILECLDQKNTYATSVSCEKDAARQAAQCDPKCTDG